MGGRDQPVFSDFASNEIVPVDINNDGIHDLIIGNTNGNISQVIIGLSWGNLSAGTQYPISYECASTFAVGDINNDNKPDMVLGLLAGSPSEYYPDMPSSLILINQSPTNNLPAIPKTPRVFVDFNTVTFTCSWDSNPPAEFFTYNLRVGVTPGGNEKFSGVIPPGFGNAGNSLDTTLYLPDGNYYFSLETVDGGFIHSGWSDDIAFDINPNVAPSNITLSNSSVAENQATGTVVGTFSTTDPNAGDTFTYSLVAGAGATDNASFSITGNILKTAAVFNYGVKNSYAIRVRTTDNGGLFYEKQFIISVSTANHAPTDISLSKATIAEKRPINTIVGVLSSTDSDVGNTFTYSLVSGSGDTDNGSFNISGSDLRTSAIFNYGTKNLYHIRLKTTDQGGLGLEKAFNITVIRMPTSDYDGDGKTDVSVYVSTTFNWYILQSSTGTMRIQPFGLTGATPMPGIVK